MYRHLHTDLRTLMRRMRAAAGRLTPAPAEMLQDECARRQRTLIAFWWIGALPWPLVFALVYGLMFRSAWGASICAATFILMLPIPWLARNAADVGLGAQWLLAVMVGALTGLACITGGGDSPALHWFLATPFVAVHIAGLRSGVVWCAVSLAVLLTFDVLHQLGIPVSQQLSHQQVELLNTMSEVGLLLMITTLAFAYDSQRLGALQLARERQDRLRTALERAEEQAREIERASEALRKTEARYRSLVQNSPMGMYFYDLNAEDELILTEANPAADQLTGLDSRNLIGLSLETVFPNTQGTDIPARYRAAAAEGLPWSVERLPYADGSVSGVFELRAFQTSPRKMVVVFMNVTDRVRAETAVRSSEREIALQAGKAEVATHVLHNVGNVLSRVKVSATLLRNLVSKSEASTVGLIAALLSEHKHRMADFLQNDERGRALPAFMQELAGLLTTEQNALVVELKRMSEAIEHIAQVIGMQQVHSVGGGLLESVRPGEIFEQALSISVSSRHSEIIQVVREFEDVGLLTLERHKVLQILVNLLSNAVHALRGVEQPRIICRTERAPEGAPDVVRFSVSDNGIGIAASQLPRIFSFGFTTRQDGHGFGLHSSANLAQEMRGALRVSSAGEGCGATFTLELPLQPERVPT